MLAIINDFRMQSIGGIIGGLDIWENAIVHSLLNNSEVWTEMSEESIQQLE